MSIDDVHCATQFVFMELVEMEIVKGEYSRKRETRLDLHITNEMVLMLV